MAVTPDILLLAGPTASGKSALSLHAARALDGEIINADSMQVYDGLSVITARPEPHEMAGVPHHLFGVMDPGERCSVGAWAKLAVDAVREITGRGKRAVFVGGTGLYFKALVEGLAPTPEVPQAISDEVAALYERGGLEALRAEAEALDPVGAARIEAGDRQRLMRLIAVARVAGRPLSDIQAETRPLIDPKRAIGVVIAPDREALYARIEARFDQMVAHGALEEARAIAERRLSPDLPAMKAVGLPPLIAHVQGRLELDEAIDLAKRDTRRYAKRQYTWFSNQHPDWKRVQSLDPVTARAELDDILLKPFFGAG
ncbi:MAG: tRNA (adenosine(37)-N6)-dimethylallyltransferase MiaA [Oceanicaulis sp.]|uniref:tRNA (adenosine(37)-N6)-dimethylallyltransferase MiaA n=1 Tax=Oceanicaulis sp. UBA2681 TaxID=1947007 RepID=UPI000C08EDF9|nr:tRNA (adenosine(37)-N6)-dimethylallyltransferase MiaA [Oceanicaulis sp. UBA2681]MAP47911.1 tRNA (adenosine(37)-N6)-dimethylallyltransferase MiaA [Oceanicaulis sp.]